MFVAASALRLAALPVFWSCLAYMALHKFVRYMLMTAALGYAFPESVMLKQITG